MRAREVREAGLQVFGAAMLVPLGLGVFADGLASLLTPQTMLVSGEGGVVGLLETPGDSVPYWQMGLGLFAVLFGIACFWQTLPKFVGLFDDPGRPAVPEVHRLPEEEWPNVRALVATISPEDTRNPVPRALVHPLARFSNLEVLVPLVSEKTHEQTVRQYVAALRPRVRVTSPVVLPQATSVCDDVAAVAEEVRERLNDTEVQFDDGVRADITGGLLPMSITLLLAAQHLQIPVLYTSADRADAGSTPAQAAEKYPEFSVISRPSDS